VQPLHITISLNLQSRFYGGAARGHALLLARCSEVLWLSKPGHSTGYTLTQDASHCAVDRQTDKQANS